MSPPVGRRLLTIRGRDLEGRSRRLPDDLGGPAWLFIAHRQHQQRVVDAWMAALADTGIPALEAPVMKRRWQPGARFIEGGMASNMTADVRRRTVCVYADVARWRAARGFATGQDVTALLLDGEGVITYVAYGPPTGDSIRAAATAAAGLDDAGPGEA